MSRLAMTLKSVAAAFATVVITIVIIFGVALVELLLFVPFLKDKFDDERTGLTKLAIFIAVQLIAFFAPRRRPSRA